MCLRLGLGEKYCNWIRLFYRDIWAQVLVNGQPSERYRIAIGVRQGCPFSPYLFNLIVEALACVVRANPNILGFKPPCGEGWSARTVKVQQLADDTTFYVQKVSSLRELECIIGDFGDAKNLRLNAQKTVGVWFGTDVPADLAVKYKWLKKGEMEMSLGVIYGIALVRRITLFRYSKIFEGP